MNNEDKKYTPNGEGNMNPFNAMRKQEDWPKEVMDRFTMVSERTGESVQKISDAFIEHIAKQWGCTDWKAEDEDVLVDWAEGMLIEDRSSNVSGRGGETTTFVGQWLGVEGVARDRAERQRTNAEKSWEENPNEAISSGMVGHYFKEDGLWSINTANGVIATNELVEEPPSLGFRYKNEYLCLISRAGRPYPSTRMGRYYKFLGNEKSAYFQGDGPTLWRVDLTGDNKDLNIDVGVPVSIQVKLPTSDSPAFQDVLSTNYDFPDNMVYTDEWCPENLRHKLDPFKLWTDAETVEERSRVIVTQLDKLEETFEMHKREWKAKDGREGVAGPDILVRGQVTRMNTEGRQMQRKDGSGEWKSYSIFLSSLSLQNKHDGNRAEIAGWIDEDVVTLAHPFHFRDVDDELWGYGQRTGVMVHGRLAMKKDQGESYPSITVYGVYTDAKKAWRQAGGGDTGSDQFN